MQRFGTSNLTRAATFFQNSGISVTFVFIPVIARLLTDSFFEIGIIVASFGLAQIISELYFGRFSDKKGTRIYFIRYGFVGCAITFGLHYFADDVSLLLLARIAGGVATGVMIPAMISYAYESGQDKTKVASVVSFHALGWMAGIVAAGITNDVKLIFLVSAGLFSCGFLVSLKMPNIVSEKVIGPGKIKKIISENRVLFTSLLLRHIGATAVWAVLPILLMERMGAELYQVSIVYIANTLASFVLMTMMAGRIKMHHITKFKIGVGLTTFVFVGLLFVDNWWMTMPFMALVGATWAFLYIGGNFYLMENNPKSTSTGIFSSTISIATVIGPVIGGSLVFTFGYYSVMYFAIAIIIVGFFVSLRIKK